MKYESTFNEILMPTDLLHQLASALVYYAILLNRRDSCGSTRAYFVQSAGGWLMVLLWLLLLAGTECNRNLTDIGNFCNNSHFHIMCYFILCLWMVLMGGGRRGWEGKEQE